MRKKSSQFLLPPMSRELLRFAHLCEESAHLSLAGSYRRGTLSVGNATEILSRFVVDVVDGKIANYSLSYSYDSRWTAEIIQGAINTAHGLLYDIAGDEYSPTVLPHLERIIAHHLKTKARRAKEPKQKQASPPNKISRRKLAESYFASFPNETIKILDICWAAGQHYREWKRWIKDQWKEGSTADLAFRNILTSGKRPFEYNKKPRPTKWQ